MKEYNGLKIPKIFDNIEVEQIVLCHIIKENGSCSGIDCRDCIYFSNNIGAYKKWRKNADKL